MSVLRPGFRPYIYSTLEAKDRSTSRVQMPLFPIRFRDCPKHTTSTLPNCKVRASSRRAGGRVFDRSPQIARLRYYIDSIRTRSRIGPIADARKRQSARLITPPISFERRYTRPISRPRFIHRQEISIVLNRHPGWEVRAFCSNVCHALPSAVSHLERNIKECNEQMEKRKPTLTPRVISITTRIPQRLGFRQP